MSGVPAASGKRFRGIDHVGVVVRDTDAALDYWVAELGLEVVHDERVQDIETRLTYLAARDRDGAWLQLVQPLGQGAPVAAYLARNGEGLHHVCLAVDDIPAVLGELPGERDTRMFIGGRQRLCCFLDRTSQNVLVELTETEPREPATVLALLRRERA